MIVLSKVVTKERYMVPDAQATIISGRLEEMLSDLILESNVAYKIQTLDIASILFAGPTLPRTLQLRSTP